MLSKFRDLASSSFLIFFLLSSPLFSEGFSMSTGDCGLITLESEHKGNISGYEPFSWDFLDLNNDGFIDIFIGNRAGIGAIGLNDTKGKFVYQDPGLKAREKAGAKDKIPYPGGLISLIYDINEDGKLDVSIRGGDTYLNETTKTLSFKPAGLGSYCTVADVNKDGYIDLLDSGKILTGRGKGNFASSPVNYKGDFEENGPIVADIDNDGKLEILTHGHPGTHFHGPTPLTRRILHLVGNLDYVDVTKKSGLDPLGALMGVGDVNADGSLDLICLDTDESNNVTLALYINDCKGKFKKLEEENVQADGCEFGTNGYGGALVTDLNNDSIPDIIVTGVYYLYVLKGLGNSKFEVVNEDYGVEVKHLPFFSAPIADYNSDGYPDLFFNPSTMYANEGGKNKYIEVKLYGKSGNKMAANAVVKVYEPGGLNDVKKLIWCEHLLYSGRSSFHSYVPTIPARKHFGIAKRDSVDVSVEFFASKKKVELKGVKANTVVEAKE